MVCFTSEWQQLADMIMEMGYNFTSSVENCRSALNSLGGRDLNPAAIARILSMMARTHSGLDDQVNCVDFLYNLISVHAHTANALDMFFVPNEGFTAEFAKPIQFLGPQCGWREWGER